MLKAPSPWNAFVILLVSTLLQAGTATAADFSGAWQGFWSSFAGGSGNLAATITQSGSSLSGSLDVSGTDCTSHPNFLDLPLTGSVAGDSVSFQVTNVFCPDDGSSNDIDYTNGNLTGNTVTGTYTIFSNNALYDSGTFGLTRTCCTVNATAGTGGSITPDGSTSKAPGESLSFTITPNTGYAVSDVKVDGVSQGAISNYTFNNLQTNRTITATFIVDCCTISATASEGGNIVPSGSIQTNPGTNKTYTITPNPGYAIVDVKVDGISLGAITSYTFTDVQSDHTIEALFEKPGALPFLPILLDE